ncbi:hypothetical protein K491DRAFT_684299 [Lophiostoma macrostomum CBS 122681]|uniref:RING-type domain-containing protein n=1 Tax=Lophiostoma macrostomum CBS 122681 TaxID=1314788 RepID=A0A6A6SPJ5_9PLEO|nr:hypothetical protein K491DRAFT_684299 [Lophiostoma macrostomum CBS 122681]
MDSSPINWAEELAGRMTEDSLKNVIAIYDQAEQRFKDASETIRAALIIAGSDTESHLSFDKYNQLDYFTLLFWKDPCLDVATSTQDEAEQLETSSRSALRLGTLEHRERDGKELYPTTDRFTPLCFIRGRDNLRDDHRHLLEDKATKVSRQIDASEEAMASDEKECYACRFKYAPEFSDEKMLEPAVKSRCGHLHGATCLDHWVNSGHFTCPLCRQSLFPDSLTLPAEILKYITAMPAVIQEIQSLDEGIDHFLTKEFEQFHDEDFGELLNKMLKCGNDFLEHKRGLDREMDNLMGEVSPCEPGTTALQIAQQIHQHVQEGTPHQDQQPYTGLYVTIPQGNPSVSDVAQSLEQLVHEATGVNLGPGLMLMPFPLYIYVAIDTNSADVSEGGGDETASSGPGVADQVFASDHIP